MLHNYLTTALRVLFRQKIYSVINIFGLAIGIAATVLIALYITDELSYDQFHKDANRIFRLTSSTRIDGAESTEASTGSAIAQALQDEVPEIESVLRLSKWPAQKLRFNQNQVNVDNIFLADSNFFNFFSFKLIAGNPKNVLAGPNKGVITEALAKRIFGYKERGDFSPIGKLFSVIGPNQVTGEMMNETVEVTGIAADPPSNSHFHFSLLLSMTTDKSPARWMQWYYYTYFKMHTSANIQSVEKKIPTFYEKYLDPELKPVLSMKELIGRGDNIVFAPQQLLSIHLDSHKGSELEPNGNRSYVRLLGYIALFIVILACINFMNLSTARAADRAKEIGIRKTVGALRKRIVKQFMLESFLYATLATLAALFVVSLVLGLFNQLAGKQLGFETIYHPQFLLGIGFLVIIIGLLAGSYPAFYMTSFKPAEVLKGKLQLNTRGTGIRNLLVVFQFVVSTSLIIFTLVVYRQINFMLTKELGFDQENVMCLTNLFTVNDKEGFKNELKSNSNIINAGYSESLPFKGYNGTGLKLKGSDQFHDVKIYFAEPDYLKTLNCKMIEQRNSSEDISHKIVVVINEAAARALGVSNIKTDQIMFNGTMPMDIFGIVGDFNFESLQKEILPLAIFFNPEDKTKWQYNMTVRLSPGDIRNKISLVNRIWKKYSSAPFEYSFLDENFKALYNKEQRLSNIVIVFTSLSVIIASLGLLGLVTYMTHQRTKEIGVRKVLGASVKNIVILLSGDFTRLILIAFIIAIPISWYVTDQWLQGFAHRIDFDFIIVAAAGSVGILVAMVTVSYQSFKAASGNPVDSLRSE